jgi:hypothetical protein
MVKWFEINLGWFFVNNRSLPRRKQEQWNKYMDERYIRKQ